MNTIYSEQAMIEFFSSIFGWMFNNRKELWISAGGGTANVLAGRVARAIGVEYSQAHDLMDRYFPEDWYCQLDNRRWFTEEDPPTAFIDECPIPVEILHNSSLPWEEFDTLVPRKWEL